MRLHLTLLSLLPLLTPVFSVTLIEALHAADRKEFADWLTSPENEEMYEEMCTRNDITVYPPPNEAVIAARKEEEAEWLEKRQAAARRVSGAGKATQHQKPRPYRRDTKKTKCCEPLAKSEDMPSNYETILMYMEDPKYVNLGPGQPMRMVRYLNKDANWEILGPLGQKINQTSRGIKYDRGMVIPVDGLAPNPKPVSVTIEVLGMGKKFWEAVKKAGLAKYVDETPQCTVFIPTDIDYKKSFDPRAHIICPLMGYTPDLMPGTTYQSYAGTPVAVTFGQDGARRVNGQRITKSDVITKNGVIHYIEKPFGKST